MQVTTYFHTIKSVTRVQQKSQLAPAFLVLEFQLYLT